MPALTHPPRDALAAFGRGALPPDELAAIAEHVSTCADCCAVLRDCRDDSFINLLREAGTPADAGDRTNASNPELPPPVLAFPDARSVLADHPQYKLLDQLGEGGMGVVFRAQHKVMGRVVALKVMAPHLTANPAAVSRFRQEVKAAGRLSHPNIIIYHDAGEAGGLHFLVMEYVEGTSLDKLVARKGPLAVPLACQFIRQAALGLQHASERGMVHRDIKPQNLMVTRKGQIKVLDFGLARFARDPAAEAPVAGASADGAAPAATAATAVNMVMGTPDYLSPEQARCEAVDARADVYSLGCTLYFLLTGRPPFERAASVFDKLLAHATEAHPPLAATRLDVPAGLEQVLARMTAKDPGARYATPAEAAAALAPFARGEGAGAAPTEVVPEAVPVVEAVIAPPAVTPLPRFESEPTAVIVTPRPQSPKRKKRSTRRGWSPARWAALGGVLVAVLVGAAVVRPVLKRPAAPTETAAANPPAEPPARPAPTRPSSPAAGKKAAEPVVSPAPWKGGAPQVLFVLPAKGLWVGDYLPVRERLEAAGVGVKVAVGPPPPFGPFEPGYSYPAPEAGNEYPPVRADLKYYPGLDLTSFRAVVFVGKDVDEFVRPRPPGPGDKAKFGPPKDGMQVTELVLRQARDRNLVLGGICTGQVVLAKHGLLDGKGVAESPFAAQLGGPYLSPQITRERIGVRTDGRIVTASGPESAAAFADALVAALRE
ncbi:protein kinase [bacterium]|nr:protein kinase [bacterium]